MNLAHNGDEVRLEHNFIPEPLAYAS